MSNNTNPSGSKKITKSAPLIVLAIIGAVLLIGFLIFFFVVGLTGEDGRRMRDARRMANIKYIEEIMEVYFNEHSSEYFQASTTPDFLEETVIPKDPLGESHNWINNTSAPQKFCVWANLEAKDAYYIASHCGIKEVNRPPTSLDDCCELTRP